MWSVSDLDPTKDATTLAEDLASHFTSITNIAKPLDDTEIPSSTNVADVLIPKLLKENVAKKIRDYKKPNSTVPGDLPKSLVGPLSEELATPLTAIYNNCLAFTVWPRNWKKETVIPIP